MALTSHLTNKPPYQSDVKCDSVTKWQSIITIDTGKDGIAEHEMAKSRAKQFSVGSNESSPDEMAQYSDILAPILEELRFNQRETLLP